MTTTTYARRAVAARKQVAHKPIARARAQFDAGFMGTIAAVMVGGMLLALVANNQVGQMAVEKHRLQVELNANIAQRQSLEAQVAKVKSAANLITVANKMGMVPAATPVFLRLSDHVILGKRVAAKR